MVTINGITYADYDQDAIDQFMVRAKVKRLRRQLDIAERRGFATTKIPLGALRELLNLIA